MPVTTSFGKGFRFLFFAFLINLIAGIVSFSSASGAWSPAAHPSDVISAPARPADIESLDGVIRALYESISFPEGGCPDWDRFRGLFSSAASPCIRMSSDGVLIMDRESFIAFFDGRIKKGTMRSFAEREIARTAETYGGLAQVFSIYEKRMNLSDPGKPARGINGVQLFYKDSRWWISSLAWQDEFAGQPIPPQYLK